MAIDTDFRFEHVVAAPQSVLAADLLGSLRDLCGDYPAGNAQRIWKGSGFNLIWRPNHGQSGAQDFFLQLMFTEEVLSFTEIGGPIANRGLLQDDIVLGAVSYVQTIRDAFDDSGQHFEPGVWINVPATTNPAEVGTVARMGTIPHGTTINLQGIATSVGAPVFNAVSIVPFVIGEPERPFPFPESDLSHPSPSRTIANQIAALDQAHLDNPNLFLSDALKGLTIADTTVLQVASDASALSSLVGGSVDNIAFLTGIGAPPTGGPNALAPFVEATFWIEHAQDDKAEFLQLQYSQRVLLNFNGLSWPHITVATLRVEE